MPLHVVLYNPEIPQNTGNIMRTCIATNAKLHLIEPLGFYLESKFVKRASANNFPQMDYKVYLDWEDFLIKNPGEYIFLTRYGKKPLSAHDFRSRERDVYFIFGKESTGIPAEILLRYKDNCFRIPMNKDVRSLNISNCVAITLYEALRQQGYYGLSTVEVIKGSNFIF